MELINLEMFIKDQKHKDYPCSSTLQLNYIYVIIKGLINEGYYVDGPIYSKPYKILFNAYVDGERCWEPCVSVSINLKSNKTTFDVGYYFETLSGTRYYFEKRSRARVPNIVSPYEDLKLLGIQTEEV